jgi:hypothetical protein
MSRILYTTSSLRLPVFRTPIQFLRSGRVVYSTKPDIKHQLTAYLQHQHQHRHRSVPFKQHRQPHRSSKPLLPIPTPPKMAFLLPGLRRTLLLTTPLILSYPLLARQHRFLQPMRCDSSPFAKITDGLTKNYASEAQTPILTESGAANPRAIRQVSMGSILGVFCGLGISVFSKPLAILIGLGIFVLQVSSSSSHFIDSLSMCERRDENIPKDSGNVYLGLGQESR